MDINQLEKLLVEKAKELANGQVSEVNFEIIKKETLSITMTLDPTKLIIISDVISRTVDNNDHIVGRFFVE